MDIRDLAAGTELYLPVEVAGALFSVGDTHAAQGDGEVCGTAIESPMSVALRFELVKGANLRDAALHDPGAGDPASRRRGLRGHDRDRARPDAGRARRGERHGRPARPAASACARSRPTCCAASAPTCGSARSSTCRTGSCRSTSRASSCSERRGRRATAAAHPRARGARGRLSRAKAGSQPVVEGVSLAAGRRAASWGWSASPAAARASRRAPIMRLLPEPPALVRAERAATRRP